MDGSYQQKNTAESQNSNAKPSLKKIDSKQQIFDKPIGFDDALDLTTFGSFNIYLIIISGVILTISFLETIGISYIVPVSECDLNLKTIHKGMLSAIGFVGIISSSHLWGFLADTKGRRYVILPTLFASFLFSFLSSLQTNFWIFLILRFFNGFFVSGSCANIYAYLGEFHTMKNRSRAIMGASVIFGITCILLPAIAWLVINSTWEFLIPVLNILFNPWRLFLIVCGLPSLFCGIALIYLPESPKFLLSKGYQKETIQILQFINKWNNGKNCEMLPIKTILIEENDLENGNKNKNKSSVETIDEEFSSPSMESIDKIPSNIFHSMWIQTAPLFKKNHLRTTLIACIMQFGINCTSNGMYMWFPEILNRIASYREQNNMMDESISICEILDLTKSTGTIVVANINNNTDNNIVNKTCITQLDISTYTHSIELELAYTLLVSLIGLIVNRVGKLPIIFTVMTGCGVCGILAVYVQSPSMAIYFYIILLLSGLSIPVVNAATVDLYPTKYRAMAICICLMVGRFGCVIGTNVVGLLFDNNCRLTYLLSGSSLIFCGLLAFFIPNITKREERDTSHENPVVASRISVLSRQ